MNGIEKMTYQRIAILLIIIGGMFAIDSYLHLSFIYKLWPLIMAIMGSGFIGIYSKQKDGGMLFLAVGEYLLFFSALALYCNFTSWRNMGNLWPLFIGFLGIVFITCFFAGKRRYLFLFFGLMLISLSIYFLLVFSIGSQLWWSIFVLLGISILLSGGIK